MSVNQISLMTINEMPTGANLGKQLPTIVPSEYSCFDASETNKTGGNTELSYMYGSDFVDHYSITVDSEGNTTEKEVGRQRPVYFDEKGSAYMVNNYETTSAYYAQTQENWIDKNNDGDIDEYKAHISCAINDNYQQDSGYKNYYLEISENEEG